MKKNKVLVGIRGLESTQQKLYVVGKSGDVIEVHRVSQRRRFVAHRVFVAGVSATCVLAGLRTASLMRAEKAWWDAFVHYHRLFVAVVSGASASADL